MLMWDVIQLCCYIVILLCSFSVLSYNKLSFNLQLNHCIMVILDHMLPRMILLLQI
jgi:hypothetical protein